LKFSVLLVRISPRRAASNSLPGNSFMTSASIVPAACSCDSSVFGDSAAGLAVIGSLRLLMSILAIFVHRGKRAAAYWEIRGSASANDGPDPGCER